jgi:heterodisulfide reductase subunit D
MEAIPGLKLVEMPRNREYSRCCGAGGGLKAGYPDIQNKMAQMRVREAEETGAEYLVSCCPFCFQGLNVGVNAVESQLIMKDMSSLVAESLLGYDVFQKADDATAVKVIKKDDQSSSPQERRPDTPAAAATGNHDDVRAAKKAERERKRAERRAARQKTASEGSDTGPAAATETEAVAEAGDGTDLAAAGVDPKAAKKAERERRRAERRAASGKEDKLPTAFAQETLEEETLTLATEANPVDTTEVSVTDTVNPATDSPADKNMERERKRAEKRAAREKEKVARRAARDKT